MKLTKSSKSKTLENIWLWTVAVVFSIAGIVAFSSWVYVIVQFLKEVFHG